MNVLYQHLTRMQKIEARFVSTNDNVKFVPQTLNWLPFPIPDEEAPDVDFVQGLKTIAGHGDPTTKEGLAVHVYAANASMNNRAFCSSDGDMLLMPQEGRLDIQTELGRQVNHIRMPTVSDSL